jgi:hypothetical protein
MAERTEGQPKKTNQPKGGGGKEGQGKGTENKEKKESSQRETEAKRAAEEALRTTHREHLARAFMDVMPITEDNKKALVKIRRAFNEEESEAANRRFVDLFAEQYERGGRRLTIEERQKIHSGSADHRWQAIDEILSEIYSKADQYPEEHFHACFDLDQQIKLTEIAQEVMRGENSTEFTARMHAIHSMREAVHNAMYLVEGAKGGVFEMEKMMKVPSHLSDVLFKEAHGVTNGVGTTHRLYEDMFEKFRMDQIRTKGENWIPPEKLFLKWETGESYIDTRVRELFKRALEVGAVDGHKYDYNSLDKKEGPWPEWKINRALHLGRAYGSVTARFPEIVATTRLQGEFGESTEFKKLKSPYAEDFIRTFNPIEHLVRKFGVGRPMAYLNYLFSGGEQKTYKDLKEIQGDFEKLTDIKKVMGKTKEERDKIPNIVWNLFSIDSRSGGVRITQAAAEEMLKKGQDDFIGINNRLEGTKGKKDDKLQEALRKNQEAWDFTLKRTPLILLKGILQFKPELQNEINKEAGVSAAEVDGLEDWLLVLKEDAVMNLKPELDYDLIQDLKERVKVKRYVDAIRKKIWEKGYLGGSLVEFEHNPKRKVECEFLVDKDGDMKKIFPFTIAVSDLPLEKLDFIRTGHIWNIERRWRDIVGAKKAQDAFMPFIGELPRLKKVEDYKKMMKPIYDGINEFDHGAAQEFMRYMGELIGRANQKLPLYRWLPAPLEKVLDPLGILERPQSYAQELFGADAACWDKINIRRWVEGLGEENYISSLGEDNHQDKLFEDLEVRRREVILEFAVRWGPFAVFLILLFLANELKKQMEEELKK